MPKSNDAAAYVVVHSAVSGQRGGKPADFHKGAKVTAEQIAEPFGPGVELALECGAVEPIAAEAAPSAE